MQFYTDPSREQDARALPDAEAFYVGLGSRSEHFPVDGSPIPQPVPHGWYWWACFPGCMPDSGPIGPFETEGLAIADAREGCAA